MNGTTSFEANQEEPGCAATECPHVDDVARGRAKRGIVRVTAPVDRRSWSLLRGRFSTTRDHKSEKARGSCRSRGRQERAHRSLENRKTGLPQLPPALSCLSGNRKSVTHVPG